MTITDTRPARNGVDVPTLFATVDAVRAQPDLAQFQVRARNEWISGTHSRSTIQGFFGAGQEDIQPHRAVRLRRRPPGGPGRNGHGPTPVELLLHAIAACLTSGLANIAAARGISLRRVASTVEGDIDLLGILGLSKSVRNGYRQIRLTFEIDGDATAEELAQLLAQSRGRSAVYDVLTSGTEVVVDMVPATH
jgi:uncharacterized OsmC-like protein